MIKILFLCHGNICRSPMAEFVLRDLLEKRGMHGFEVASAATSSEETGNPVHPGTRRKLAEHGISCAGHMARQLQNRDYDEYDLLVSMFADKIDDLLKGQCQTDNHDKEEKDAI